ncbi:MAG: dTDP-4-dehydrorhamnose reductase [Deltaproteobacteria bacterium]|nr:dTDP-4-dehydrorhamnose reductase [Deltaproteobacteria bacterium]
MRVWITGAGGMLGSECVKAFSGAHTVLATDLEVDVTDRRSVERFMEENQPWGVVNCAAYTRVDDCEIYQAACRALNADAPGVLAAAADELGCRLIHVSTDFVFSGDKDGPYTEQDATGPLSAYGKSKLAGEAAVLATGHHTVVRTAWLYGANGRNFLKTILAAALAGRPLYVVDDQHGSPTWAATLARQLEVLCREGGAGVYHAAGKGRATWFQLASRFLRRMGIDCEITPVSTDQYPTAAVRPENSELAPARLEREGLSVFRPWQDDLDAFVDAHKTELLAEAQKAAAS